MIPNDHRIEGEFPVVSRTSTDTETVMYEFARLEEFLNQFEATPGLRDQVTRLIDRAAWEQLTTSLRGLRSTVRNIGSQAKGSRLPYQEAE